MFLKLEIKHSVSKEDGRLLTTEKVWYLFGIAVMKKVHHEPDVDTYSYTLDF